MHRWPHVPTAANTIARSARPRSADGVTIIKLFLHVTQEEMEDWMERLKLDPDAPMPELSARVRALLRRGLAARLVWRTSLMRTV